MSIPSWLKKQLKDDAGLELDGNEYATIEEALNFEEIEEDSSYDEDDEYRSAAEKKKNKQRIEKERNHLKKNNFIAFPKELLGENGDEIGTIELVATSVSDDTDYVAIYCWVASIYDFERIVCPVLGLQKKDYTVCGTGSNVFFARVRAKKQKQLIGSRSTEPPSKKRNGKYDETRNKWKELCSARRSQQRHTQLNEEIKEIFERVQDLQQQLITAIRLKNNKEALLGVADDIHSEEQSLLEFDNLLANSDIENIEIDTAVIKVYTAPIIIAYNGDKYDIGKFEIKLHTNGADGCVKMFNRTRRANGAHHPHINDEGKPCLGNISEVLPHLIAERNYGPAIALCIQYLKSYEDGEGYEVIEEWPKTRRTK
ncbi:MAG: hypothetical protein HYW78_02325 [Parcubacteria group bacterium]|nr:hypothetical protein [Parcubacteria group bacterium]